MAREMETRCQLCGAIINDRSEITGTSKSIQRKLVTDEGKRHSSRTVEGRTKAKRLLEEAHVEVQAAQNKGNCWRRIGADQ